MVLEVSQHQPARRPPEWNPGADPAPESDDGPVPPDDLAAETSVAG